MGGTYPQEPWEKPCACVLGSDGGQAVGGTVRLSRVWLCYLCSVPALGGEGALAPHPAQALLSPLDPSQPGSHAGVYPATLLVLVKAQGLDGVPLFP